MTPGRSVTASEPHHTQFILQTSDAYCRHNVTCEPLPEKCSLAGELKDPAAAAAPVTLPEGSMSPIPPVMQMPPTYVAIVMEMQERPTAGFVQHLYRTIGRPQG